MKRLFKLFIAVVVASSAFSPTEMYAADDGRLEFYEQASIMVSENWEDTYFGEMVVNAQENGILTDGVETPIDNSGSAPVVVGDSLAVPAAPMLERIGYEVEFISSEKKAILDNGDNRADITIGDSTILLNGESVEMDETPFIKNNRLMLSVEALGTIFDLDIEYPEDSPETAIISNPYQTRRIIVKTNADKLKGDYGADDVIHGPDGLHLLQYDSVDEAKTADHLFDEMADVLYSEPDVVVSTTDYVHHSWGFEATETNRLLGVVSGKNNQSAITIAVVDTGAEIDHPFLTGRIDPRHKSFVAEEPLITDRNGHGTHVSGIVADLTGENVKILPIKVMNAIGRGSMVNICAGIDYAVTMKADVINLSLGTSSTSKLCEETVKRALDKNAIIVASAGNDGVDTVNCAPANIDEIIVVSAVDSDKKAASFSNYGASVDIAAPGVSVYSSYRNGRFKSMDGTSMAAPHVAAIAALVKSAKADLTAYEFSELIKNNVDEIYIPSNMEGKNFGAGFINSMKIYDALEENAQ